MSEHEELVKELREVLGRIPDDIADNLPLTFLRSCLAVLQGSTAQRDTVTISRECAERAITNAEWERDNAEHVADEASAYRDTKSVGYYTKRKETAERDIEELREALEKDNE